MSDDAFDSVTRRTFIQTTAAATAAFMFPSGVRAAGSDVIRVGVIGCGGRGTGAARDVMQAADGVEVVALGDLAPDRLAQCRAQLAGLAEKDAAMAAKYRVTDDRCFTGFDAYQKVIAADVDYVILAAPPAFRPAHLEAAVAAGRHVFTEKPVAVDPAGIRAVLTTCEAARHKNLGIGAGTQRRHQTEYVETIKRVHDGAIGTPMSGQVFWNQGGLWTRDRKPDWTDAEWQIRNWLYFTWLSGDHIVEQHVHNIDVANWVFGAHPIRATGAGGRQWRTEPKYGHIYDHFAIDFEYASGARVLSMCRQIDGTTGKVAEHFIGTKGSTDTDRYTIRGANPWTFSSAEKPVSPYVQEHTDLIASIRAGTPINELKDVAESTLTAIMGREAAYTGKDVTWTEILNADQDLQPPQLAYGPLPVPPVPMPGRTRLARRFNDA
ncbi:MAG TPA: Gfo/Idh/MocA family oxidoreductase [Vicinamibacterales bacterium]|nr:Gfo/Idh/MocA family oxidoreductase [Vicinamibacterales bacterium]